MTERANNVAQPSTTNAEQESAANKPTGPSPLDCALVYPTFIRQARLTSVVQPHQYEEWERSLLRTPEDALAFVITASLVPQFDIV
jgi:hypothetical protein